MTYQIHYFSTATWLITTKHVKLVTQREALPLMNSDNPLNQKHCISTIAMPMATMLIRVVTYRNNLARINLHDLSLRWVVMLGHVTNNIHYISTCRRPSDTKLGKVLTNCDRLPHLKSCDFLITWPTQGHATFWKKYISTFTRFMDFKPSVTLGALYSTCPLLKIKHLLF